MPKSDSPCPVFRPGRSLPMGECECGWDKSIHPPKRQPWEVERERLMAPPPVAIAPVLEPAMAMPLLITHVPSAPMSADVTDAIAEMDAYTRAQLEIESAVFGVNKSDLDDQNMPPLIQTAGSFCDYIPMPHDPNSDPTVFSEPSQPPVPPPVPIIPNGAVCSACNAAPAVVLTQHPQKGHMTGLCEECAGAQSMNQTPTPTVELGGFSEHDPNPMLEAEKE